MSCFLVLNSFVGDDQEVAAKKLALMFRMAPKQANAIIKKVAKGQVWQSPKEVSDQQAAVAENYLTGIGFQVERSGQQEVVDQISGVVALEEEPSSPGIGEDLSEGGDQVEAGPPGEPPGTDSGLRPPGNGGTTRPGGSPPQDMPIGFHGNGGGLFKIMLINWILTILTLGIYSFWGKTKVRRYLCEHSSFVGDRFYYHGTGGELFKGALIFGGIFGLFNLGIYSIGQFWGMEAQIAAQAVMPLFIVLLLPVIMVGAFRYRLSRTAWRGIRFSFRGKRKSALWLYVKGYLLILLTAGFYMPFFTANAQRFWIRGSYFGSQPFKYDGEGKDIVQAYLLVVLAYLLMVGVPTLIPVLLPEIGEEVVGMVMMAMYIPLVIAFLWYTVYIARYHWSKTEFAGGRFNYDATAWQWFLLNFTNFLIIVCTLGFGIPWATIRSRQFLADHLTVVGNMQLSQVVQEAQKSSALGEGAADGFDMDIDIGI
jgi:uncharacterized membrane protein YjgN (DUF898 family)